MPTIKHLNVITELLGKIDEVIIEYEKLSVQWKILWIRALQSYRERSNFDSLNYDEEKKATERRQGMAK